MKTFQTENINIYNFFEKSKGTWKHCKKPKRKPNYVSYKRDYKRFCILRSEMNVSKEKALETLKEEGINIKYYKHHFVDYDLYLRIYYEDKRLGISSRYWYGKDKKGTYVIRESDHWGKVASCNWETTRFVKGKGYTKCAKIYFKI